MKRSFFALSLLIALTSCQQEENNAEENLAATLISASSQTTNALSNPNGLRISEFIEEGVDKTALFSPYLFVFNSDGSVLATSNDNSINGSYIVFSDDGNTELSMTFPLDGPLYELNDDWYFISHNQDIIRFDDNGDILEFQEQ
jgi:hypothetical protein